MIKPPNKKDDSVANLKRIIQNQRETFSSLESDRVEKAVALVDARMTIKRLTEQLDASNTVAGETIKRQRDEIAELRKNPVKPRAAPTSFKPEIERMKTNLSEALVEVKRAQHEITELTRDNNAQRAEKSVLKASLDESRQYFADMKLQLLEAEKTIARLEGYVDRVKEDDNARDGFDVVKQDREVIVPRRNPEKSVPTANITSGGQRYGDTIHGRPPRRHWTDF